MHPPSPTGSRTGRLLGTRSHYASPGFPDRQGTCARRLPKTRKPLALLGPCFKTGHREPTRRQRPRHGSVRALPESPENGRSCPPKPPPLSGTREHPPTRLASLPTNLRTSRRRPAPFPFRTMRRPRHSHQGIATPAVWQELYEQRPQSEDRALATSSTNRNRRALPSLTVSTRRRKMRQPVRRRSA